MTADDSGQSAKSDRRLWWWRPLFHKHESEAHKQVRSELFDTLPREAVSDEYGTRPKWHPHIERILAGMPDDAKRLHPNEPRWQTLLAPKYIKNQKARETFMRRMSESDADKAYLYYPLGAKEPNVWFEHEGRQPHEEARYTVPEFEAKYGASRDSEEEQ